MNAIDRIIESACWPAAGSARWLTLWTSPATASIITSSIIEWTLGCRLAIGHFGFSDLGASL